MTVVRITALGVAFTIACSSKPDVAPPRPPSPGEADGPVAATCPAGPRVQLELNGDDLELREDPSTPAYDELAIVDWRIDLNGDRALDVGLTFMGTAGSKGESVCGVFVNCGGDEFVTVWGPDHIFAIELPPDAEKIEQAPGTWRDLIAVMLQEQGHTEQFDYIENKTLRFAQGRYREVP